MRLLYLSGTAFVLHVPILCWFSSADTSRHRESFIYSLSATFSRYIDLKQPTRVVKSAVKYEKQFDTEPDAKCPVALSKFAL